MAAGTVPLELPSVVAIQKVRELASDSRNVILVAHAKARGRTRAINRLMVERCLQKGVLAEGPYVALKTGNWRMNISRRAAGEDMTCVVEIDWPNRLLVVTVF